MSGIYKNRTQYTSSALLFNLAMKRFRGLDALAGKRVGFF
jgi:hypothetical protein